MTALDNLWDHFLDVARYAKTDGDRITDARMAIEAAIRRDVADPERIAAALVYTDDESQDLLDDGESLGRSFYEAAMPRAREMATLLVVASLNATAEPTARIDVPGPVDVDRLAQALSCWSAPINGEGDPDFTAWAAQIIRSYLRS